MGYSPQGRKELDTTERLHLLNPCPSHLAQHPASLGLVLVSLTKQFHREHNLVLCNQPPSLATTCVQRPLGKNS